VARQAGFAYRCVLSALLSFRMENHKAAAESINNLDARPD